MFKINIVIHNAYVGVVLSSLDKFKEKKIGKLKIVSFNLHLILIAFYFQTNLFVINHIIHSCSLCINLQIYYNLGATKVRVLMK